MEQNKRQRALTASEATHRLIEAGYEVGGINAIADNEYTLKYGKTTLKYENPQPNTFDTSIVMWDMVGVWYSIEVYEHDGKSNVTLNRWNGRSGMTIVSYNKLNAQGKKEFMDMCLNAKRVKYKAPYDRFEDKIDN